MQRFNITALFLLAVGLFTASAPASQTQRPSLLELEQRRADIDVELANLASYTLRGGTGNLGYRSAAHTQSNITEWIRIELGEPVKIDQVVMVPTLWRDTETGVRMEGFPRAFRILTGTEHSTNVVAHFTSEDLLLPRIAPLSVSFEPVTATWVEIEATDLSPNIQEKSYSLQLAEVLIFSGQENVALKKKVKVPKGGRARSAQQPNFLTDGFTPYLMDAAHGPRSHTELMKIRTSGPAPTLTIDLLRPHSINQINLHTASAALSIPMINFSSWAVPRHVRVSAANRADFSDEQMLFEHEQLWVYHTGPIIMQRFPKTQCRYIRVTILDHRPITLLGRNPNKIAFSEIEVLSNSKNVALGAPVSVSADLIAEPSTLQKITDGLNYYGEILPMRDWMNQLARRHDLETERPLVMEALSRRYARQKTNVHRLIWLAVILASGTVIIILTEQVMRQRAILKTREQIAANLHDELGANLHAIALFGDLARQEVQQAGNDKKWDKLVNYVEEARTLTEQATKTARYCTHTLEATELYENLAAEMKRTAERLLTDLEHTVSFSGEYGLQALRPRRRVGLYLFYKECLTNIIRHSGARCVTTTLTANGGEIQLTVRDDGTGTNELPRSLKRRARLLKAKASVLHPDEGGTEIILKLHTKQGRR